MRTVCGILFFCLLLFACNNRPLSMQDRITLLREVSKSITPENKKKVNLDDLDELYIQNFRQVRAAALRLKLEEVFVIDKPFEVTVLKTPGKSFENNEVAKKCTVLRGSLVLRIPNTDNLNPEPGFSPVTYFGPYSVTDGCLPGSVISVSSGLLNFFTTNRFARSNEGLEILRKEAQEIGGIVAK